MTFECKMAGLCFENICVKLSGDIKKHFLFPCYFSWTQPANDSHSRMARRSSRKNEIAQH